MSTPEGLGEWFAEKVNVEGDLFSFFWNGTETKARLAAMKENKLVRFEWLDEENEEENYFRIQDQHG